MDTFNFLHSINEFTGKIESICSDAKDAFEVYTEKISDLEKEVEGLHSEINSLNQEIDLLSGEFNLKPEQDNIVTRSCIEDLFNNLDRIPINKLEEFINQFK